MILVVGGSASGKRAYVRSLGYSDAEMSAGADGGRPVLVDAQELVRGGDADVEALAARLASCKDVVICRETGSGIVPVGAGERAWRDRTGALARELAARADSVVRMTCGIPQALKGALPDGSLEVVLMRHGSTEAGEQGLYAGATDVALSGRGERESLEAGVFPQVETVYVSPLSRARRTAELCFPRARQVVVDGLREMDFGAFEGRSADEMAGDADYRAWVDGLCEGRCPGGERRSELVERVAGAVDGIVRGALRRGERRVVVVAHGGTVMAAMSAFSRGDRGYFDWQVGNCAGFRARARFERGRLVLEDERRFDGLGFMGARLPADEGHPQPGSSFFSNRACEHFPCHEGIDEHDFNCLFCYCPLYALGPDCGGEFTYTEKGRKNCRNCPLPHVREEGARLVAERYELLAGLAGRDGREEARAGGVAQEKRSARMRLRALREGMGAEERARADALIAEAVRALPAYREADEVFAYLSVGTEVDTRGIIRDAWRQGKRVAVPRCVPGTNRMEWYAIRDFANLETSPFGVEEPLPDADLRVDVPPPGGGARAVALVPGYTFDADGFRVGYGGGFYDVFLPAFGGVSIGLCRSAQFSRQPVPRDAHDVPVDVVATDG